MACEEDRVCLLVRGEKRRRGNTRQPLSRGQLREKRLALFCWLRKEEMVISPKEPESWTIRYLACVVSVVVVVDNFTCLSASWSI
jgi:hypothetical protein